MCCPFFCTVTRRRDGHFTPYIVGDKTLFHRFLNSYRIFLHIAIITHPLDTPTNGSRGERVFARRRQQAHEWCCRCWIELKTMQLLIFRVATQCSPHGTSTQHYDTIQTLPFPETGRRGHSCPTILPRLHGAAESLCSLRIHVVIGDQGQAVQIFAPLLLLIRSTTFVCFFSLNLHLVGCRRMRL